MFIVVDALSYNLLVLRHGMPPKLKERNIIFQINIIGLKMPTGGRQTIWLFTSMTEELNLGLPRNNSS